MPGSAGNGDRSARTSRREVSEKPSDNGIVLGTLELWSTSVEASKTSFYREGNINRRQDDDDIVSESLRSVHATFY